MRLVFVPHTCTNEHIHSQELCLLIDPTGPMPFCSKWQQIMSLRNGACMSMDETRGRGYTLLVECQMRCRMSSRYTLMRQLLLCEWSKTQGNIHQELMTECIRATKRQFTGTTPSELKNQCPSRVIIRWTNDLVLSLLMVCDFLSSLSDLQPCSQAFYPLWLSQISRFVFIQHQNDQRRPTIARQTWMRLAKPKVFFLTF